VLSPFYLYQLTLLALFGFVLEFVRHPRRNKLIFRPGDKQNGGLYIIDNVYVDPTSLEVESKQSA
jgi:hypothetical protein